MNGSMLGLAPPAAGVGSSPATPTERESVLALHFYSLFFQKRLWPGLDSPLKKRGKQLLWWVASG